MDDFLRSDASGSASASSLYQGMWFLLKSARCIPLNVQIRTEHELDGLVRSERGAPRS